MVTYLLPRAVVISVNSWTLCCIADPLQDGSFSCVCSSYNEYSELDLWKLRSLREGLFGIRARARARAGLFGIHWFGIRARERVLLGIHWIGSIDWSDGASGTEGQIITHWFGIDWSDSDGVGNRFNLHGSHACQAVIVIDQR